MKRIIAPALFSIAAILPFAAQADGGDGSRQAAGGAHMSSYVGHYNHDPRSVHAQANGTGQILGAPMFSERAGAHRTYRGTANPRWAVGR